MEIVDCQSSHFFLTVDIWTVDKYSESCNLDISPRWKLLGKLFKDEISSVYKYDASPYHLMLISVIDIALNEYGQKCSLIRLTYGRENY